MIELSVCIGSSCHIKGSYNVIQTFQQMIEENNLHGQVDFKGTFCMKQCDKPVSYTHLDVYKRQTLPLPLSESLIMRKQRSSSMIIHM